MSLRFHVDNIITSISLSIRFNVTSIPLRSHSTVMSIPLRNIMRFHFGSTPISLRLQHISLGINSEVTSMLLRFISVPLGFHDGFTSVALVFHVHKRLFDFPEISARFHNFASDVTSMSRRTRFGFTYVSL